MVLYLDVLLDSCSVSVCVGLKVKIMCSVDLYNINSTHRHMHGVILSCVLVTEDVGLDR
jgi:hypothetical protein